jgi:hypothetical protein
MLSRRQVLRGLSLAVPPAAPRPLRAQPQQAMTQPALAVLESFTATTTPGPVSSKRMSDAMALCAAATPRRHPGRHAVDATGRVWPCCGS